LQEKSAKKYKLGSKIPNFSSWVRLVFCKRGCLIYIVPTMLKFAKPQFGPRSLLPPSPSPPVGGRGDERKELLANAIRIGIEIFPEVLT
jgi:hypothetical protein